MKPCNSTLPVILAILLGAPAMASANQLDPRVMVLPVEGDAPDALGALSDDVAVALARGAARTTSSVARATASLSDTAVIVGCDPESEACRDAVAAALNVDQLLLARIAGDGDVASVEVTAVTREGQPVVRSFAVRPASRAADLAALEREVPLMLEAGEARRDSDPVPVPDPDPDPDPDPLPGHPDRGGGGIPRGPLLVTSAGVALVAIGGVAWALAGAKQGEIDDAATETAADLDRLANLEDAARMRATFGNVLVVGGVLTVAVGVSWWLWDRRTGDTGEPTLSVAPAVFGHGGGLAVGGRW